MDELTALECLGALSQATRLRAFKAIVASGPDGIAAGEIARLVAVPQNTMSTHLAILARCGLVRSARHSRSITYIAELDQFRAMTVFLLQDCCGGRPEICAPILAEVTACCTSSNKLARSRRAQ